MQISQENLDEYKRIYKEKYWNEISDKEALEQGIALLNFMKIVLKNDSKKE
jgi:hypothetical protein